MDPQPTGTSSAAGNPGPENLVRAEYVNHPPPPPKPRGGSRLMGCFVSLGLLLLAMGLPIGLLALLLGGNLSLGSDPSIQEEFHSLNKSGDHKVAIISIEGVILDGEGFFKKQIDRARKDEDVKAIVLRVNSPGGTVNGSDYMHHHLSLLREDRDLPVVVSMGGIAASGGYYVSMAVGKTPNTIFAEPTTWTGSIGVIIPHYNLSGLAQEIGVEDDSIGSHRLKGMGGMLRAMTDEEKAIFQSLVDDSFQGFKEIIKQGRPNLTDEKITEVATGQVFTTNQAMEHGLVDKEGYVEEAIDRVIELAGLDKADVKVVKYKRPLGLSDLLVGAQAKPPTFDLRQLLSATTPRAYYLCTWLPGVL